LEWLIRPAGKGFERRSGFTLACMAVLIIIALIAWSASALAEPLPVL
jgi:hypothetical protein